MTLLLVSFLEGIYVTLGVLEWGSIKMTFQQAIQETETCLDLPLEVPEENLCTESCDEEKNTKEFLAQNLAPKPTEKLVSGLDHMENLVFSPILEINWGLEPQQVRPKPESLIITPSLLLKYDIMDQSCLFVSFIYVDSQMVFISDFFCSVFFFLNSSTENPLEYSILQIYLFFCSTVDGYLGYFYSKSMLL